MQRDAILRFSFHDAERRLIVETARALTAPGRVRDQGSPVSHRGGTFPSIGPKANWTLQELAMLALDLGGQFRDAAQSLTCPRPVKAPVSIAGAFALSAEDRGAESGAVGAILDLTRDQPAYVLWLWSARAVIAPGPAHDQ